MIRSLAICLVAAVATLSPVSALAGPKGCPPGLAKKSPACVPPGQARNAVRGDVWLQRGDYFDRGFDRVVNPRRLNLPRVGRSQGYYRDGRIVYRVDEQTRRVLEVLVLSEAILGN